jgi:hypothetical protein
MLARGKLQVASRAEVAQAYRVLLEQEPPGNSYEKPVYGSPDVANDPVAMHKGREEHDEVSASEEAVPSDGEILDSAFHMVACQTGNIRSGCIRTRQCRMTGISPMEP